MKGTPSTRKKLLNPGGLLTEAGYTDALVALATEMKAKRAAKATPTINRKQQKTAATGFILTSDDGRKAAFTKDLAEIDAQRQRTTRYKNQTTDTKTIKIKAA